MSMPHVLTPTGLFPIPFGLFFLGIFSVFSFGTTLTHQILKWRHGERWHISAKAPPPSISPTALILYRNAVHLRCAYVIVAACSLIFSIVIGLGWAVVYTKFHSSGSIFFSYAWLIIYEPLLYVVKFYFLAPIMATLNPKKVSRRKDKADVLFRKQPNNVPCLSINYLIEPPI